MKKDIQQGTLIALGTGLTSLMTFVYTSAIVGKSLTPVDYSDFTSVLAVVMLMNIALGPISSAVTRYSAVYSTEGRPGRTRMLYQAIGSRVLKWGGIAFVAGCLVSVPLAWVLRLHSASLVLLLLGIVCLTVFVGLPRGVMRGTQSIGRYTANVVGESAIRLSIGFLLLLVYPASFSALLAYVIALVVISIWGHFQASHEWKGHSAEAIDGGDIRSFSLPLFVAMFIFAGFENLDMLFVKQAFSPEEAASFGPAFIMARAIAVVATPFTVLVLPKLTVLFTQGKPLLKVFAVYAVGFVVLVSIPLVLFCVCDDAIIRIFYPPDYASSARFVFPVALSRVPTYLCGLVVLMFVSQKNFKFLKLYLFFFVLQIGTLIFQSRSPVQVPWAMLVVQSLCFLGLLGCVAIIVPKGQRQS